MRLYWAEFSDAEMAHQNIMVGPITQGDAKAVLDKLSAVGAKGHRAGSVNERSKP